MHPIKLSLVATLKCDATIIWSQYCSRNRELNLIEEDRKRNNFYESSVGSFHHVAYNKSSKLDA